jgi:ubiquinone/menaquinone biosynthesis C-methylase UbiE
MLPKTKTGEKRHRKHKRQVEITIVLREISDMRRSGYHDSSVKDSKILEFGSGDGFQIPYLRKLGDVVASDVYESDDIKKIDGLEFVKCGIDNTPFPDKKFDVIYSNHVIEHLEDIYGAFAELKRIGKPDCIYAFSVPTNIWLLLSVPAQYFNKSKSLMRKIFSKFQKKINQTKITSHDFSERKSKRNSANIVRPFLPSGHGVITNFIDCYRAFRINSWEKLFSENGFNIVKVKPLLLYGPSEWPLLPTTISNSHACSSVLFILKKHS